MKIKTGLCILAFSVGCVALVSEAGRFTKTAEKTQFTEQKIQVETTTAGEIGTEAVEEPESKAEEEMESKAEEEMESKAEEEPESKAAEEPESKAEEEPESKAAEEPESKVAEEPESKVAKVSGTVIPNDITGIPDMALYQAMLEFYDGNADGVLTEEEVHEVYLKQGYCSLELSGKCIKDLTGIDIISRLNVSQEKEYSVQAFYLSDNQISDITPLGLCAQYADEFALELAYNQICDIEPLRNFGRKIDSLTLNNNRIQSIPLGLDVYVSSMRLENNEITDISGMSGENGFYGFYVNLSNNKIEDISPLINRGYGGLYLDNNNISVLPDNLEEASMFRRMNETLSASNSEMAEIVNEGYGTDGRLESRFVLFSLSGNPLTETEARRKLPGYVVNLVTPSGYVWMDEQGFLK